MAAHGRGPVQVQARAQMQGPGHEPEQGPEPAQESQAPRTTRGSPVAARERLVLVQGNY